MRTAGLSPSSEFRLVLDSPLGPLTLSAGPEGLTEVAFGDKGGGMACPLPEQAAAELAAYFAGQLRTFTVPLAPAGTEFQQRVWAALREIPFGKTATYGEIAARVGNPRASRAVGQANNRNPIPILIPCHRVIGASGQLTGYAGGLAVKQKLLVLERAEL